MIKVAINGFGRIGRLAFRQIVTSTDFDIVAINDLGTSSELAYLVKYDTVHRSFHEDLIKSTDNEIIVNNIKRIKVYNETNPENLPWKDLDVDLVLECTGKFTKYEDAYKHITAGAKKVLISLITKYNVNMFAIGNGTASRESEMFVAGMIKEANREPEEDYSEYLETEDSLGSLGELFKDKFKNLQK